MRTLHLISHTHWDREWYLTFQQFRLRLVHLIDNMLEYLDQDAGFKHFMLDGQTIVLDDYLHMRPDKETILRTYIQNGRILIGPWHILPDMFLVGPEAHIRNLLQGERTVQRFGPKMQIGYIPDPFGHPAQVPQILRGFDIDVACLWRGLGNQPIELLWQSPDGSRVLLINLRDSYSNGASLSAENLPAFAETISALGDSLAAHSVAADQLIMYGTDHMEPPQKTSKAIAHANKTLKDVNILHSTLPAYVAAIQPFIKNANLSIIEGELRACQRTHLLPGVLSTRIWIKQRNLHSETLLTRWAEPFSTFSEYVLSQKQALPATDFLQQPSPIIRQAWRLLMENHPHDSICGCSIDQVHDEMKVRFDQVDQIGEELIRQSLERLAGEVNTLANLDEAISAIVVFNPLPFRRTEPVAAEIRLPEEAAEIEIVDQCGDILPHETIGIGAKELVNASMTPKELRAGIGMISEGRLAGLGLRACGIRRDGKVAHLEAVFSEDEPDKAVWERCHKEIRALLNDPTLATFHVRARTTDVVRAIFCAPQVPGLGWSVFLVRAKGESHQPTAIPPLARTLLPLFSRILGSPIGRALVPHLRSDPATKRPYRIENDFFIVEAESAGTLSVIDKRNGAHYRGLNRFIDGGDCGDEYNCSPPAIDMKAVPRLRRITVRRGAVHQTLTLSLSLRAPASLSSDRQSRSRKMVEIPIKTEATLTHGLARVDIHTEVENRAKDHRLRVHFPTPFRVDFASHDGHFEVIQRKIGIPEFDPATWVEDPRPEVPQRAFTSIYETNGGFTLANRGLPEVEALQGSSGTEISLTLLRCVGWLSRDDFSTRRGHAGPFMETPAAQMIGKWTFDYSIIPHIDEHVRAAHELAYAFEVPMRAVSTNSHTGLLPGKGSFVAVHAVSAIAGNPLGNFYISAIKQAENGNGWLVRGYNAGRDPLHLTLIPFRRFSSATLVNLSERKLADLPMDKATGAVNLELQCAEIVTIMFAD